MTTTLSDEEFRRLNEQLCELKNQNYQCDVSLRKSLQENQTLRAEIDQLRRQSTTTTTTSSTNESTEKLKKLNPFTFAKNVAAKVDQRLHQFSLSSTNDIHHDDNQSNQSFNAKMIEQNYQIKINELENKIQQLELKNSELSNFDTNSSKCASIIKECIERYVQKSLQRQSHTDISTTDSFWIESDYQTLVNGQFEQKLIDSITNLDDFKLIIEKFIQYFEQKEAIFENIFDKINKKQQESTNVIQSNDDCNGLNDNQLKECIEKYEKLIEERDSNIEKLNQQCQMLEKQSSEVKMINNDFEKQIKTLENRIVECEEDKKINEKRSLKYLKELRKLVNSEKNRADKLQNILNQETINTNAGQNNNKITTTNEWAINNSGTANSDRCSSTGSWTYMNDQSSSSSAIVPSKIDPEFSDLEICDINNKNMDDIQQNQSTKQQSLSTSKNRKSSNGMSKERYLESENNKLLEAIVTLHQEKWSLEERVNILEHELQQCLQNLTNGDNGGNTNEIPIQQQKSSPTSSINSILKMINYIRDKSSDTQNSRQQINDAHRKLQRMVEEILTKNMHLQANLEDMSRELEFTKDRLRRYEEPTTSSKS
ncbi:regulation of modification of synaptic structure [Dermatophagoides pteronyssinus]|uniref:Regulation of modification of synaptic structure n=1 Tax=Dermatophagoides pteronyssinus TaxID=6956 RepID=A0ABQ8JSI4_DERPT|nr:regulation of modification of synaptic structure [Dermatophagoides pteronyssinus]